MSYLQTQTEIGKTFFEINQNTFQALMSNQQENFKKYLELNSDFSSKLPEVKDVAGFMELQREYAETLWGGIKDATRVQADILKTSVEDTTNAVQQVFTTNTDG